MVLPVSPLLVVGFGTLWLGEVLNIVGVATTHWMEASREGNICAGLFQKCDPDCQDIEDPSNYLKAVRAMVILGLISGFVSIALAALILANRCTWKPVPKLIMVLPIVTGFAALIFTFIGIGIYAGKIYKELADRKFPIVLDVNLGYSFILPVVGGILMACAGVLVYGGAKRPLGGEYHSLLG